MGAWHAYTVPENSEYYGGFSGPMMASLFGEWISPCFAQWSLWEDGKRFDWNMAVRRVSYLPGSITQYYVIRGIEVEQKLLFTDKRSSMIRTVITNSGKVNRKLSFQLEGVLWSSENKITSPSAGVVNVTIPKHNATLLQRVTPLPNKTKVVSKDSSYVMRWDACDIAPKGSVVLDIEHQYCFKTDNETLSNSDFVTAEKANTSRWQGYLDHYFQSTAPLLNDSRYARVAAKAIVTMVTNYRSEAGDLKHPGTFPSLSYHGFYGFWSWDSWKHAVAYAYFAPEMAKNNLRSMFDYQDRHGMVADCIYMNAKENNWRDTKPPLASWAVVKIFEATKDSAFVREILPKLERYHQWWYDNRDHDKNGLCEYGSTDGSRIAAAWESGMDNAVRFDHAKMIKNNEVAWSLDQESVDLNSYLYYDACMIQKLHHSIGDSISGIKDNQESLKKMIQNKMFGDEHGFFFDIDMYKKTRIETMGPEGWIPLWTKVATKEQARSIVRNVMDTCRFNTFVPFPTLDASHPKFNPLEGYWRGPVWLDQAYFAIKGMRNYGYNKEANRMTCKILDHCQGLLQQSPIHENYHPITGEGLNAIGFSWSSAHLLMMLREE
ncbi:hypothetical protein K4L44_05145 [Halosquirtibacter laminarini]|uniref:Uncharacterized protein n=2 Tax=Halosquirtibacter laminarini TaxID=3374600 RepID=A0AC61NHS4_9BACT|nr:hypothetical protein K4L44_05145 [Prolixibacteraceae bacterium]